MEFAIGVSANRMYICRGQFLQIYSTEIILELNPILLLLISLWCSENATLLITLTLPRECSQCYVKAYPWCLNLYSASQMLTELRKSQCSAKAISEQAQGLGSSFLSPNCRGKNSLSGECSRSTSRFGFLNVSSCLLCHTCSWATQEQLQSGITMASVNRIDSNFFVWLRVCLLYVVDSLSRALRLFIGGVWA